MFTDLDREFEVKENALHAVDRVLAQLAVLFITISKTSRSRANEGFAT